MIEDKVPEEEISRYRERLYYEQLLMKWLDEIFHLFYNQYMRGDRQEAIISKDWNSTPFQASPQRGLKIKRMVDSIRTLICLLPERVREELKEEIEHFKKEYRCVLYVEKPWSSPYWLILNYYFCIPVTRKESYKEAFNKYLKRAGGFLKPQTLEKLLQKIDSTIHEEVIEACQELLEKIVVALEREGLLLTTRRVAFLNFPETEKGEEVEK